MGYTRDTMFFFIRKHLYPLSPPRPQEPGNPGQQQPQPAAAAQRTAAERALTTNIATFLVRRYINMTRKQSRRGHSSEGKGVAFLQVCLPSTSYYLCAAAPPGHPWFFDFYRIILLLLSTLVS